MMPSVSQQPNIIGDFPDGVLLSNFLQTLHPRSLTNGKKFLTETQFQDKLMDRFKKVRALSHRFSAWLLPTIKSMSPSVWLAVRPDENSRDILNLCTVSGP